MGETEKNINDILEKLVIVTDAANNIFPEGKTILVYELDDDNFKDVQKNFRKIDNNRLRFKIEISGTEIVFINNKIYEEEVIEEKVVEKRKIGFWERLFPSKRSKPSIKK
jgi:hypothetical protein